ncbi:hypothetical protein H5410_018575 [Solanum commersonii]|uniref:Uncharacterized protein n=1 Tax=Solanum commersonii TaxID=4109 RepID=A0A9J6A3S4_SOLCO|nr:hypothetical protein H5410_018575 [Solanum commersonii]
MERTTGLVIQNAQTKIRPLDHPKQSACPLRVVASTSPLIEGARLLHCRRLTRICSDRFDGCCRSFLFYCAGIVTGCQRLTV